SRLEIADRGALGVVPLARGGTTGEGNTFSRLPRNPRRWLTPTPQPCLLSRNRALPSFLTLSERTGGCLFPSRCGTLLSLFTLLPEPPDADAPTPALAVRRAEHSDRQADPTVRPSRGMRRAVKFKEGVAPALRPGPTGRPPGYPRPGKHQRSAD